MLKALGILVVFSVGMIVNAVVQVMTIGKLWAWFVAAEYGPGPSQGAWFGIVTILGLVVSVSLLAARRFEPKKDETREIDEIAKEAVLHWVSQWFGLVLLLALAWTTGAVMGWVR